MHQLQPLRRHLLVRTSHAGHVAAGSVKPGENSAFDGVGSCRKDDWNLAGPAFAATAEAMPPAATSTVTRSRTNPAASSGSRPVCASAHRYSILTFWPST